MTDYFHPFAAAVLSFAAAFLVAQLGSDGYLMFMALGGFGVAAGLLVDTVEGST